jgi:hypothetical protein
VTLLEYLDQDLWYNWGYMTHFLFVEAAEDLQMNSMAMVMLQKSKSGTSLKTYPLEVRDVLLLYAKYYTQQSLVCSYALAYLHWVLRKRGFVKQDEVAGQITACDLGKMFGAKQIEKIKDEFYSDLRWFNEDLADKPHACGGQGCVWNLPEPENAGGGDTVQSKDKEDGKGKGEDSVEQAMDKDKLKVQDSTEEKGKGKVVESQSADDDGSQQSDDAEDSKGEGNQDDECAGSGEESQPQAP